MLSVEKRLRSVLCNPIRLQIEDEKVNFAECSASSIGVRTNANGTECFQTVQRQTVQTETVH